MKNIILLVIAILGLALAPATDKGLKLSDAAIERTDHHVLYTSGYVRLAYPNGDVPEGTGVCTDVVIRSYRNALGIDLQQLIHEDMKANFGQYPSAKIWGMTGPDKNIDHRRTQNQECFFTRKGAKLPNSKLAKDYLPGDLVYWGDIASGHVGIVVDRYTNEGTPMVVHNIGAGPKCEDFLFASRITGHYRWLP